MKIGFQKLPATCACVNRRLKGLMVRRWTLLSSLEHKLINLKKAVGSEKMGICNGSKKRVSLSKFGFEVPKEWSKKIPGGGAR